MDQSTAARKPSSFDPSASSADTDLQSVRKVGGINGKDDKGEDIAASIHNALADLRHMLDDIAKATRGTGGELKHVAEALTAAAAQKAEAVAESAKTLGREGVKTVSTTVSNRPLTAVAVAAGVGLLVGMLCHSGSNAGRRE